MKLERIDGVLMLFISPDSYISFLDSWVEQLRSLPYDQFGEYIRTNIYPALSEKERRLWNKSTISNRVLHAAIGEFK